MRYLVFPLAIWLLHSNTALAQTAPNEARILQQRDQLRRDLANTDIGAGYAQMLNFFVEPSISASRLDSDDADYDIFKVPLQYGLGRDDGDWEVLLRATLSHATAEETFSLVEGETIDGEWTADSAAFGAGVRWALSEQMAFILGGELGVSRLDSDADYNGPIGRSRLAPIIDGVLVNWDTNAWIASANAGMDYKWQWLDRYDMSFKGRYTYSHISSYSESRDLPSFSESTGTASLKLDLRHPWRMSLWERPLFGIANIGGTAFTGSNRDALGFTHFYEIGYAIGIDLSQDSRYIKDVSIGYQVSTGSDVDGYSILLGWTLK